MREVHGSALVDDQHQMDERPPPATLLRAPWMQSQSGAWLEGLSKSEAQELLIIVPWLAFAVSFVIGLLVYAANAGAPYHLHEPAEIVVAAEHGLLACICLLYIIWVLIVEVFCLCCCGKHRTKEGIAAVFPLVLGTLTSVAFMFNAWDRRLFDKVRKEEVRGWQFGIILGSWKYRLATVLEFSMQIMWLYAAEALRIERSDDPEVSRFSKGYLWLIVLWLATLWDPRDLGIQPADIDHIVVLLGCSARFFLFAICLGHSCRRSCPFCSSCCCCCGSCGDDSKTGNWRSLGTSAIVPGRQRLRYLLYFLMTRPAFLLLVNFPIGYPLSFCPAFASTVRCGFSLIVATALRPASSRVKHQHDIEEDTRGRFKLPLALRLADFGNETYTGAPPQSSSLRVVNSPNMALNGVYEHNEGVFDHDAPVYKQIDGNHILHKTSPEEWAFSLQVAPTSRLAFAQDTALAADLVRATWYLRPSQEGKEPEATEIMVMDSKRRFQMRGDCARTDAHWLLVEEDDPPHQATKVGLAHSIAELEDDTEAPPPKEVSIIVAFRGTHTFQNVRDDARIRMAPVRGGLMVQEEGEAEPETRRCWWQRSSGGRSLERVEEVTQPYFDFDRVEEHLRAEDRMRQERNPNHGHRLSRAVVEDWAEETASRGWCWCLGTLCALLLRGCLLLCLPFRQSSDTEEDDEEFAQETLHRVRLHSGFGTVYQSIKEDVTQTLFERLRVCKQNDERVRLYITGHSLGGAVAALFALDIASLQLPDPAVRSSGYIEMPAKEVELLQEVPAPLVYTFGAPRLGNAAMRSIYNVLVPDTFRIVAALDLVPTMPPSIYYRQIGREIWLDEGGGITYVMSWAMRALLPARNRPSFHAQVSYFRLLNKAFYQQYGVNYPSAWGMEDYMQGVLDGGSA